MKRKQHDSFSRFLMKLLCLMLAIVLAALAGATALFQQVLGKLHYTQPTASFGTRLEAFVTNLGDKTVPSGDLIGGTGSGIVNLLLVGSDQRGEESARSDTMLLVTYHRKTGDITLTSFLRDMYLPIPGHGSNRINAAYYEGGTELLDETLKENFGLHIDGNLEVDFSRFSEIIDLLGCKHEDIIRASGKTGMGVEEILKAVVERIPHPTGDEEAPLQALIFDSVFNSFRGIIAYFKIENGVIRKGDKVKFFNTGKEYDADEIGVLKMDMIPRAELRTGDVGYIISGIKTSREVKVGDTITHIARPCEKAIAGFEEVKPMVFAGVYPIEAEDYENLRASLEKLQLNDASLTFQPESSLALGFGFRCGFLGLLHMEIVQERLDREFDMNVITTVPNVSYMVYDKQGHANEVHNPGGMPDPTLIDHIEEPFIDATIITATDYIGPIMTLCLGKRGELVRQNYVSGNRVEIHYKMPLGEIVIDFYDKLKSISKGYASFDYHQSGFRPSKLVKLDILLNGEPVDALSTLTHVDNAYNLGKRMCEKLKELIPRQQFDIAIQAAIGAKIIARETIKAVRKDVTAKCYGGDISRKRKLLEKQKEGKKRMKQIGTVEVPQKAFLAVLKLD